MDQLEFYVIKEKFALHKAFRKEERTKCILACSVVGWQAIMYKFERNSMKIEDWYDGITEETEITPEINQKLIPLWSPKLPHFPTYANILEWISENNAVPIFAGAPPLAEGILQQKANDAGLQWQVQSAGTNHYHIGSPPHALSQKVALLNGIDISNQKARRISKEDMEQYDIVYALASDVLEDIKKVTGNAFRNEKVKLFMDEHPMATFKDVPDPWYGAEDGYHEVFKLINEVSEGNKLIALVTQKNAQKEDVEKGDLYDTGTIGLIHKIIKNSAA